MTRRSFSGLLSLLFVISLVQQARAADDEPKKAPGEFPAPKLTREEIHYAGVPAVQEELEMTPEQVKGIADHWRRNQDSLAQLRQAGVIAKDQYKDQMDTLQKDYENKIAETLTDKQSRRLAQVTLQLQGHRLLVRPAMAKLLDLSAEQVTKLKAIQTEHGTEAAKHSSNMRLREGLDPKVRAAALASLIELDRKTEKAMEGVLTPVQQKKLEGALGPKVKFRESFLDRQHMNTN